MAAGDYQRNPDGTYLRNAAGEYVRVDGTGACCCGSCAACLSVNQCLTCTTSFGHPAPTNTTPTQILLTVFGNKLCADGSPGPYNGTYLLTQVPTNPCEWKWDNGTIGVDFGHFSSTAAFAIYDIATGLTLMQFIGGATTPDPCCGPLGFNDSSDHLCASGFFYPYTGAMAIATPCAA